MGALFAKPDEAGLEQVRELLTDEQYKLFLELQPSEQRHALAVFARLQEKGETHPDLLRAALLHDIGKTRYPLRLWERVAIVLAKALFPKKVKTWGRGAAKGLRRALVIAEQHAIWGAAQAGEVGLSPLAVNLIRRHEEQGRLNEKNEEDRLLGILQAADDAS
jgi:putative nucleotidyltransferase with HDIG domain